MRCILSYVWSTLKIHYRMLFKKLEFCQMTNLIENSHFWQLFGVSQRQRANKWSKEKVSSQISKHFLQKLSQKMSSKF